jgi:hypothetical protein
MSKLHCRVSIAVAFVAALSWSQAADAQVYPLQPLEPGGLVNNLATGVAYDSANQAMAVHRLHHLQSKLGRHVASGHVAAADHDARRISSTRYRIVVDEWLIRKNMGCNPGYYPYPLCMDPITSCAIAQYHRPW